MLSAKQIQNSYNDLYVQLREYIWPATIVANIADLEIACYKAFPDIPYIKYQFNRLKTDCLRYVDDEELQEAFEDFDEMIDGSETLYAKLDKRREGAENIENL